jgi:hypothetical protein
LSLALLFFVLFPAVTHQPAHGTAIAILRTRDEIVVAADSLATLKDGTKDPKPFCKIRQVGKVFFVMYGAVSDQAISIARASILATGSVAASASAFHSPGEKEFRKILSVDKPPEKDAYFGVAFLGFENAATALSSVHFSAEGSAITIERRDCPPECPPTTIGLFVGAPAHRDSYAKRLSDNPKVDPIELARSFVDLEIRENSIHSGPPIDILRIDNSGPHWIQQKKECQQINSPH